MMEPIIHNIIIITDYYNNISDCLTKSKNYKILSVCPDA